MYCLYYTGRTGIALDATTSITVNGTAEVARPVTTVQKLSAVRVNDNERFLYLQDTGHRSSASASQDRSAAMIQFSPVEHAITEDGEWVTVQDVPHHYHGRLLCDFCHTEVFI